MLAATAAQQAGWVPFAIGLTGTVVGAILSTTTAYIMQRRQFREAQRQRDADTFAKEKQTALALFFKMEDIFSAATLVSSNITRGLERAERDGLDSWRGVRPLAAVPPPVAFSGEEKALLFSLGDNALFNDTARIDAEARGRLDLYAAYCALHRAAVDAGAQAAQAGAQAKEAAPRRAAPR